MKRTIITSLIAVVILSSGCSTIKKFTTSQEVETIPVVTEELVGIETPDGWVTNSVPHTNWITVTNSAPSNTLKTGIRVVTGNLPIPGGQFAGEALIGLLSGGFMFMNNRRKNKAIAEAKKESEDWVAVVQSTVHGVEGMRDSWRESIEEFNRNTDTQLDPDSVDARAKKWLEKAHQVAGHADKIQPIVDLVKKLKK